MVVLLRTVLNVLSVAVIVFFFASSATSTFAPTATILLSSSSSSSSSFSTFHTSTKRQISSSFAFIIPPHQDLCKKQLTPPIPTCLYQAASTTKDWDAILAAEEGDDDNGVSTTTKVSLKQKIPYDMKYNQRNCERCNQNYQAIIDAGGPGADIYGCVQPKSNNDDDDYDDNVGVFWFLGKVSHVSDITIRDTLKRLYPMVQQHAANLRPLDLFGAVSNEQLDIWYAPINTELDVAYNRPTCIFTKIIPPTDIESADIVKVIKASYIGFQGEIYEPGEDGFRTLRYTKDGTPSRPEITGPTTDDDNVGTNTDDENDNMMVPTDEQMEQIQAALDGKDINAIYEEQERRKRDSKDAQ